jgi:hypothetical protein
MEKVGFMASYWLEKQLIEIERFLRQQKSPCHYNDYVNVFRAKRVWLIFTIIKEEERPFTLLLRKPLLRL